jgi:hypothetical protein
MYRFHINLFAAPRPAAFACTWEDAAQRLEQLPRLIFELDGSFVLSGDADGCRWQVDGHLFDFENRLHRVELHGGCPPAIFDDLLRCVGWPAQQLVFEMVREGMTLDDSAFRASVLSSWAEDGSDRCKNAPH